MHTIPNSNSFFVSEARFNKVYPSSIHRLSDQHWAPIPIARAAAGFLGQDADFGAGIGKFCLVALPFSWYRTEKGPGGSCGIGQMTNGIGKCKLPHRRFSQIDLSHFDHSYFFKFIL